VAPLLFKIKTLIFIQKSKIKNMSYSTKVRAAQRMINNEKTTADAGNLQDATMRADVTIRDWFGVLSHQIHLWEEYVTGDADEQAFLKDFTGDADDIHEALEMMTEKLSDFFESEWNYELEKADA